LLCCKAQVNAVWRTSMEVGVRVEAENPLTGEVRHTSTAYLTMVAIDDEGRPAPAPPLLSESEIEQRRRREAELRRRNRLSEREQILADRRPSRLPGSSSQFRGFLARRELENGHRNSEPLDEWIDQAPLLPVGAVSRSDRDQKMIRGKLPYGILERRERVVGADRAPRISAHLVQLPENRAKALVRLLPSFIRGRHQPLEPSRERRRYDQDFLSRVDQRLDTWRNVLWLRGGFACSYQQSLSHPVAPRLHQHLGVG